MGQSESSVALCLAVSEITAMERGHTGVLRWGDRQCPKHEQVMPVGSWINLLKICPSLPGLRANFDGPGVRFSGTQLENRLFNFFLRPSESR